MIGLMPTQRVNFPGHSAVVAKIPKMCYDHSIYNGDSVSSTLITYGEYVNK